jgi:Mce-associated membrane protein
VTAAEPLPDPPPRRGRRTVVGSLVAVVLVVAVVLAGLGWCSAAHERALRTAGVEATAAARRAAVALTTYDHRSLDVDRERVEEAGTARFREYFASIGARTAATVRRLRVTARGSVVAAAPDVRDERHVRVLLFVDQQVRARGTEATRTEQPRLVMEMVRQDGRWLVDRVDLESSLG